MRKLLYVLLIAVGLAAVPSVAEAQTVYNTSCTREQFVEQPRFTKLRCSWNTQTGIFGIWFGLWGTYTPGQYTSVFIVNYNGVPLPQAPGGSTVYRGNNSWYAEFNLADPDNTLARASVGVDIKLRWGDTEVPGGNPIELPACTKIATPVVTGLSCVPSNGGRPGTPATGISCTWTNYDGIYSAALGYRYYRTLYNKVSVDGVPVTYGRVGSTTETLPLTSSHMFWPGDNNTHTISVQAIGAVYNNVCPEWSAAVTSSAAIPLLAGPTITAVQPSYGGSGYSCSLNFAAMSGLTSYDVIQNGVTLISRVPNNSITTVTHDVTGLTANTAYAFAIKQYGMYGANNPWASAAGPAVSCLTPPVAPVPSITTGYQTVTVSWPAVTGATSYRVLLNTGISADTTNTSYTFTGLANVSSYSATVAASNGSFGPTGATSTATTVAGIPIGLTATPSARKVVLTWMPVTGASDYMIQRNGTYHASATMPPFNDTNLTDNTTYTYAIASRTNTVPSPYSATVSATTPAAAAGAVTALGGYRQITVTWTASAGATHYTVYRDGSAISACTNITVLLCTDTGRSDNTSHAYYVIAKTNGVPSDASATVTAHTAPAQITDLAVTGSTGAYALTWSTITGAAAYKVESSSDQNTWAVRAAWVDANSYTSSSWPACNSLYWRVTSMGPPVGETQIPSIVSSAVLAKTLPNAPTGPSAANNETATVTISWSQPTDNSACTNMSTYFKRRNVGSTIVTSSAVTPPYVDTSATGAEEWHYVLYNVSSDFGTSLNAAEVSNVAVVPSRMRGRVGQ